MRRWATLLIVAPTLAFADEATEVRDHLREGLTREPARTEPPPGEANDTAGMLSIGFTFR